MKQTTLFEHKIQRLPNKVTSESTHPDLNSLEPKLKKVSYKASSNDKEVIEGFDMSIKDWIYPTNYPVREYQLQIVQECLFKNTLVCLPTGLGKTFIASVVIYNFYRWYPSGKIIFVAPTRPLVCQQMIACQDIIPIDKSDYVELTGSINRNHRINLWKEKRVFFLTAQVLVNDLTSNICPGSNIVLIVLDEAHKASKNHSYCQAIREITGVNHANRSFRVLGLSATPGDEIQAIQDVIQNLLISHIELRTDECKDIKMYSHERLVEEVIVPLGSEVISIRDRLLNICSPIIERLKKAGAINGTYSFNKVTKYGLLKMKEEYKAKFAGYYKYNILTDFSQAITLYYGVELVQQHGLKPTFLFFSNAISNSSSAPQILDLMMNKEFMDFYAYLEQRLSPDVFILGHPKLGKLQEIVKNHFSTKDNTDQKTSRVIIFSQIRDSVDEIIKLLKEMEPLVRPIAFMGKTKNVSQREQMEAMRLFTEGTANVLVSTCIGEEGLDIGEVDLIICFDSQKSPIRLIQRAGRTGRKRQGRVVMLLSEGKEVGNYRTSLSKKSRIHAAIFEGYKHLVFYPNNPRMIPLGIDPVISYQNVTIAKRVEPVAKKPMRKSTKHKPIDDFNFTQNSQIVLKCDLDVPGEMHFLNEKVISGGETFTQRYQVHRHRKSHYKTQPTFRIGHSRLTRDFISILKLKEMHSRGKTNMIFHLSSSRIVDIDEPMTESEEENSQHSLNSLSLSLSTVGDVSDTAYEPIECLSKQGQSVVIGPFMKPFKSSMTDSHFNNLLSRLEQDKPDLIGYFDKARQTVLDEFEFPSLGSSFKNEESFYEVPTSTTNDLTNNPISSATHRILDDFISPTKPLSPIHHLTNKPISSATHRILDDFISPAKPLSPIQNLLKNHQSTLGGLCTSTPMTSNRGKPFPLANILSSFNIAQNSSAHLERSNRKKDLLSSFNVPINPSTSNLVSNAERSNRSNHFTATDNHNKTKSRFGMESAIEFFDDSHKVTFDISSDLFGDVSSVLFSSDGDSIAFKSDDDCQQEVVSDPVRIFTQSPKPTVMTGNVSKIDCEVNIDIPETQIVSGPDYYKSDEDLFSDNTDMYSPISNRSLSPSFVDNSFSQDDQPSIVLDKDEKSPVREDKVATDPNEENVENISDLSESFLNMKSDKVASPVKSPSFGSSFCLDSDVEDDFLKFDLSPPFPPPSLHSPFHPPTSPPRTSNESPMKNVRNPIRDFFYSQAVISGDNGDHSDDEDDEDKNGENDCFESDFIDDSENCAMVNTQMHQVYLQSIKSPQVHKNVPLAVSRRSPNHNSFIYSQTLSSDDDYLMDSFVIPDNYVTPKKKRKRVKLSNDSSPRPNKKFRRLAPLSDSFN